jgi:hypothetical protein
MIKKLFARLARPGARALPQPPPRGCSQRLTQARHLPPWAVPAVAIAACNGGLLAPGPSTGTAWPFVFLVVAGGMVAGSTETAECAGGDGGDGGSDTDISTWWTTTPLSQTTKVPFCAGGQCAQASISTSRLWCAPSVPAQFKLPVCGTHFAFLASIVIATGHTRAPFPSTSSTTPSATRRPCRGALQGKSHVGQFGLSGTGGQP